MIIEVLRKEKKWYWIVKANNGKVFAHSEQYYNKSNAIRSAKSFINQSHKNPDYLIMSNDLPENWGKIK
jgi:uncharacterized protein YegP (UPF0339 family)